MASSNFEFRFDFDWEAFRERIQAVIKECMSAEATTPREIGAAVKAMGGEHADGVDWRDIDFLIHDSLRKLHELEEG